MDDEPTPRADPTCDWATMERDLCNNPPPVCPIPADEPVCIPARRKPVHLDPEFNYRHEPAQKKRTLRDYFSYYKKPRVPSMKPVVIEDLEKKRISSIKPEDVILLRTDENPGEDEESAEEEQRNFRAWITEEFGGESDGEEEYGEYEEYDQEAEEADDTEAEEMDEDKPEMEPEIVSDEAQCYYQDSGDEGIFTEAELRFLVTELPNQNWTPTFCLKRILFALKDYVPDVQDKDAETRVLILWKFYRRRSKIGVLIPDVKYLMDILVILEENFRGSAFAHKLINAIQGHYSKGLRIKNMTEKFHLEALDKLFKTLGELLNKRRNMYATKHGISIITKLTKVALRSSGCPKRRSGTSPPDPAPPCYPTLSTAEYFLVLENSILPEAIIKRFLAPKTKLHGKWLKLVRLMTDGSIKLCKFVTGFPILDRMLLKLNTKEKPEKIKILCNTVKIIFNLYANPKVKRKPLTCRISSFRNLLAVFLERSRMISSKYLVNLRNDVAFAILLLVKDLPELRGGFELYGHLIAGIVSSNVFGTVTHRNIVLDATTDDFEFLKTLVWILKYILEADTQATKIIQNYKLMSVFMRLLMGPCDMVDKYLELGEISAMDSMLNITWHCLSTIARKLPACFQHPEGIEAMLNTLEIYAEHGQADISAVALFLDICRTLLTPKDETMSAYFVSMDGMEIFTKTLKQLTKTDWPMSDEASISNVLMCCSLMSGHKDKQRDIFMENNGVKILLRLLNRLVYAPPYKRHMNSVIHISLADCIWQCLADSPSCLESFLLYEGMFRMLELLEISAGPGAQMHILSCILELCEYPRCIDQLLYWKRRVRDDIQRLTHGQDFNLAGSSIASVQQIVPGDKVGEVLRDQDLSLSALLCEIWREEEERLGVKRDKDGVIASIKHPLMSVFARGYSRVYGKKPHRRHNTTDRGTNGPASLDMMNSIRPKIYLLIKKITDATNTEATVYGGLSLKNQVTMQIITNMLDLKRGEIWLEVVEGLRTDGIHLVESDRKSLDLYFKVSQNKVSVVIDTQRYLIRRAQEDAELKERQFYETIKSCHFQDHLRALKEAEYFARTSNYFLLIDKRLWQKTQIERAVINIVSNARLHRTTDDTLNITNWTTNRTKFIESEPRFSNTGFDEEQSKREAEKFAGPISPPPEYADGDVERTISRRHEYRFTSRSTVTYHRGLLPTHMKSPNDTPEPDEDADRFFEVDAAVLQRALLEYLMDLRRWNWKTATDDPETAWSVRTKWRSDWYH